MNYTHTHTHTHFSGKHLKTRGQGGKHRHTERERERERQDAAVSFLLISRRGVYMFTLSLPSLPPTLPFNSLPPFTPSLAPLRHSLLHSLPHSLTLPPQLLPPSEKRRLRGKLIECFKIKGFTNVDASKLFSVDETSRTRSNGVKLRSKQV